VARRGINLGENIFRAGSMENSLEGCSLGADGKKHSATRQEAPRSTSHCLEVIYSEPASSFWSTHEET
jgi:hypothetical protein